MRVRDAKWKRGCPGDEEMDGECGPQGSSDIAESHVVSLAVRAVAMKLGSMFPCVSIQGTVFFPCVMMFILTSLTFKHIMIARHCY